MKNNEIISKAIQNKKSLAAFFVSLAIAILFFLSTAFLKAEFFSETVYGEEKVIKLLTADDLIEMSDNVAKNSIRSKDLKFELQGDISLKNHEWNPIGDFMNPFEGDFNGNGYIISNLKISGERNYAGLFGFIGKYGKVSELIVKEIDINVKGIYVGGIAGGSYGAIENSSVSGKLSGFYDLGGIAGHVGYGTVNNCRNHVEIKGVVNSDNVGGIVGRIYGEKAKITNCVNYGNISGDDGVGGIVGLSVYSSIENCTNKGIVKGGDLVDEIQGFKVNTAKN